MLLYRKIKTNRGHVFLKRERESREIIGTSTGVINLGSSDSAMRGVTPQGQMDTLHLCLDCLR